MYFYKPEQLEHLHTTLYEILSETIRVCEILAIPYFLIGGSAIGAYFWEGIIPFDDDVDIGMKREDYERFLCEAPAHLKNGYFLQWFGSEPHMPYYFAKIRKDNTLFVEDVTKNIDIHHGIFVDIIPFDRIPSNPKKERRQRKIAMLLNICLSAKELWLWKYFGKSAIQPPHKQGFLNCLLTRIVVTFVSKSLIYKMLYYVQTYYNNDTSLTVYNNVLISADHIKEDALNALEECSFGPLKAKIPARVEEYLYFHYPNLKKHLTPEEIAAYTHAPLYLSFTEGCMRKF